MILTRTFTGLLVLILIAGPLVSCNGSDDKKAQAIYDKAVQFRQQGRELDALKEFDRLKDFKKTKVHAKASAMLLKEGISLGSSLNSWTIKLMESIQFKLRRRKMDNHPDGNVIVPISTKDAWDNNIRIRYTTGAKISFFVMSAGEDKKFDTKDDLKLYELRNTRVSAPRPASKATGATTNASGSVKSKTGESQVNLEDLVKSNKG